MKHANLCIYLHVLSATGKFISNTEVNFARKLRRLETRNYNPRMMTMIAPNYRACKGEKKRGEVKGEYGGI